MKADTTSCRKTLVTADNFVQIFVGWEGVGLCSYFLSNYWFTRIQANKAASKAMLVNRVGDFGSALGIFGILICFGSVDYATVFALAPQLSSLKRTPPVLDRVLVLARTLPFAFKSRPLPS